MPYGGAPAWIDWTDKGMQRTVFAPGAFAESIAMDRSASDVALWLNHRGNLVFARRNRDELGLCETDEGLFFMASVQDQYKAQCLSHIAEAGQLHGVSPGWWASDAEGKLRGDVFWVTRADLREISLITAENRPAFRGTWASVERIA